MKVYFIKHRTIIASRLNAVKNIMGFIIYSSNYEKMNCPELDAMAPKAEANPNPRPLALKGKASVTYRKKIAK